MTRYRYAEDIEAALSSAGPRSPSGWRRARCPFCMERVGKEDTEGTLSINERLGGFKCFRCEKSGRYADPDEDASSDVDAVVKEAHYLGPPRDFTPLGEPVGATAMCLEPARAYLRGRGVPERLWKEVGIGACASGWLAGRVVVPMILEDGKTWDGWVARAWHDNADRPYLYPRGMPRGELLFNGEVIDVESDEPVIVVEGVFDALHLWPDAVAVLGKPSHAQTHMLAHSKRPVAVCLDGDAWREGWSLAVILRHRGQRAGNIRLPPLVDPDELPADEVRQMARDCIDEELFR